MSFFLYEYLMIKKNIKNLSREELRHHLVLCREPPYRADQILRWLMQKGVLSFSKMTNLSSSLREYLERDFFISRLQLLRKSLSRDGTEKYLFSLSDRNPIETVLISEGKRLTLCLSTQAGCGMGCKFCATADNGLSRNLQSSEILDQILEVRRIMGNGKRLTNLVFMGMGEPLANYVQTKRSLNLITDSSSGMGFSPRKITISTVGIIPQIRRLMEESNVNLAISLHATTDSLRTQLMPINVKYKLSDLIECCRDLPIQRRRRITFEYLLIPGLNNSLEQAGRLSRLLNGIRCKINLIPFNSYDGSVYRSPEPGEIDQFKELLIGNGFQVNVRKSKGQDIGAACGQLRAEYISKEISYLDN